MRAVRFHRNSDANHVAVQFNVSRESLDRLKIYAGLLRTWQKRINLVAPSTLDALWVRHIADGLQLLRLLPQSCRTIADIGSGSGVPGVVLAIMLCDSGRHVHLVESNGKKAAFLREVLRQTGAAASVHLERFETACRRDPVAGADVVCARAVAPLCRLLELSEPLLKKGAIGLFHKGQDVDSELTEATKYWRIDFEKHPSETDSRGCILEIKEIERVARL